MTIFVGQNNGFVYNNCLTAQMNINRIVTGCLMLCFVCVCVWGGGGALILKLTFRNLSTPRNIHYRLKSPTTRSFHP